jgi:glucan 1,3-beta-glucosidase
MPLLHSTVLGDRTLDVLTEHWESWITESDVETMYQTGESTLGLKRAPRIANLPAFQVSTTSESLPVSGLGFLPSTASRKRDRDSRLLRDLRADLASLPSYLNNTAAYQAQLDRVLSYAHARGMYAVIDLHGLPGSQNGEQTSVSSCTLPSEASELMPQHYDSRLLQQRRQPRP